MTDRSTTASAECTIARRSARASNSALFTLALSTLLAALGTSVATVGLPTIAHDFSAPYADVQWVVLSYLVAMTASLVVVGPMGDRMGKRRLWQLGVLLFVVSSAASSMATTLWWLVAARAAQGVAGAVLTTLAIAMVGDVVPTSMTGRAMGLLGTTSAIGTAIGPSLGGALIAASGWHALFAINVPLGLLTLWFGMRVLPMAGAASSTQSISTRTLLTNAGSMLGGPIVGPAIFANVLVTTVVMATLVVGPFFLSRALELSPTQVGLAMSVGPTVAALVGVPAGRLVDRYGAFRAACVGLVAMTIGSALLTLTPLAPMLATYLLPLALLTAGYALFQAANGTALLQSSLPASRGVVSSLIGLSRNVGLILGASAMGSLFAAASTTRELSKATPSDVSNGLQVTFIVAIALLLVAFFVGCGRRWGALFTASAASRDTRQSP